jgi:hypothetical protein
MSLSSQNANMYTRMESAGVISTRIYTTVGASGDVGCTTSACTYGGAVKALNMAATYGMTVTVGVLLPPLSTNLASFYTNSSAITAFLSTFNTTVTTLMTYPNLLMWCVPRRRRARGAHACVLGACVHARRLRARRTERADISASRLS